MRFLIICLLISATLFLTGCLVNGLPRDLKDEEVTWVLFTDHTPEEARAKIIISAERIGYACRAIQGEDRAIYGCGRGPSVDKFEQVKGVCSSSPSVQSNAICDIFYLDYEKTGIYSGRISQPNLQRAAIEDAILGSGALIIPRPLPTNNRFYVNRTLPRTKTN